MLQKAPDRQSGVILTTLGAVIVFWLLGGPDDAVQIAQQMLLPAFVGYEIGAQCAAGTQCTGSAPQGRE